MKLQFDIQSASRQEISGLSSCLTSVSMDSVGTRSDCGGNDLLRMLQRAADTRAGVTLRPSEQVSEGDIRIPYNLLRERAVAKAQLLQQLECQSTDSIVLLHFDNHQDNIEWFWAVIAAGYLPAISTPLAVDTAQRERHLLHLHRLLKNPIILTSERLLEQFLGLAQLRTYPVELFDSQESVIRPANLLRRQDDLAVLMLTSGSTGNAKAVPLTNAQIWSSVRGKSQAYNATKLDVFLNWIGFDHVANLLEIHLLAMSLCAEQIHVQSQVVLSDPLVFLEVINKYRVSRTFAPNFFLNLLERRLASSVSDVDLDLSCLVSILSGGEANVVQTGINLTRRLFRYHVIREVLAPGYGLTESCAAMTCYPFCPSYEMAEGHEFSSIGNAIPGAQMRVRTDAGLDARTYEVGNLELTGPVIFKNYYNNSEATQSAFTIDGWFKTGDRAYFDSHGKFNIAGRTKEIIIVNGIKFSPQDIENALVESHIPGIELVACFSHRPRGAATEEFIVAFHPTFDFTDPMAQSETAKLITRVASTVTGRKPYRVLPLPKSKLWRSSLGKLSRVKIQMEFENGAYHKIVESATRLIKSYRSERRQKPETTTEEVVLKLLCEMLNLANSEVGVMEDIFSLGVTSITLIELMKKLRHLFPLHESFTLIDLLSRPVIRDIADMIDHQGLQQYIPVVPLHTEGTRTPLWLIHPAAGNIFCFLPLARCFTDRPVYAMRARGLKPGEEPSPSLRDTAETYCTHIKRVQPSGPYALAGYSLGTTLSFEIAKLLEARGNEVALLAAIDSPPHVAPIVQSLNWAAGAVLVSYFLDLVAEECVRSTILSLQDSCREDIVKHLLAIAKPSQREALSLDAAQLLRIANVTNAFGDAAKKYVPHGSVRKVDVFYCTPLALVCMSKDNWVQDHLSLWKDFSRSPLEFHECSGHHVRMLDNTYVRSFYGKLQAVLDNKGI